jgi:hypothetical protein
MSTTTPIKENNKQKVKNTQAFHKKLLGFLISILWFQKAWQNFPKF